MDYKLIFEQIVAPSIALSFFCVGSLICLVFLFRYLLSEKIEKLETTNKSLSSKLELIDDERIKARQEVTRLADELFFLRMPKKIIRGKKVVKTGGRK